MTEVTELEQEIIKAVKFKKLKEVPKRQDYLAALVKAIDKLPEGDFDNLSDEAADWFNAAVMALNKKQGVPDFSEPEDVDEPDPTDEPDEADVEGDPEEEPEDEADPDAVEEADAESENEAAEAAADKAKAKAGKGAKTAADPAKVKAKKPEKTPSRYASITGEKDRYGVIKGTKTADAIVMYEKGCTTAQIVEALGGRHYNILKELTVRGHLVEKLDGGVWKVTHREDLVKKTKAKK